MFTNLTKPETLSLVLLFLVGINIWLTVGLVRTLWDDYQHRKSIEELERLRADNAYTESLRKALPREGSNKSC